MSQFSMQMLSQTSEHFILAFPMVSFGATSMYYYWLRWLSVAILELTITFTRIFVIIFYFIWYQCGDSLYNQYQCHHFLSKIFYKENRKPIMNPNSRTRRRQLQTDMYLLCLSASQTLNKEAKLPKIQAIINSEPKKIELIDRLNEIIEKIGNAKNVSTCIEDGLILSLEKIEEEAKMYDFKEIVKMANLAIGKRILNIELERKRTEIQNKIQKKRQIEQYFRQNRIKKISYEDIALQKIKNNTFIVKPYNDGKAFVQSTIFYDKVISCVTGRTYEDYFEQCQYLETIKHVNKIFFNNFSNSSSEHGRKQAINNPVLKIGILLFLVLFSLIIALSLTSHTIISMIIFIIDIGLVVMMGGLALQSYCCVRLTNNQLQETVMEITSYFEQLNERNRAEGHRYEWKCPPEFLYLEVKFHDSTSQCSNIGNDGKN